MYEVLALFNWSFLGYISRIYFENSGLSMEWWIQCISSRYQDWHISLYLFRDVNMNGNFSVSDENLSNFFSPEHMLWRFLVFVLVLNKVLNWDFCKRFVFCNIQTYFGIFCSNTRVVHHLSKANEWEYLLKQLSLKTKKSRTFKNCLCSVPEMRILSILLIISGLKMAYTS